jgi:hypothetical protein
MECFMSFEMLIGGQGGLTTGIWTTNSFSWKMGLFVRCEMAAFHVTFVAVVALEWTLL